MVQSFPMCSPRQGSVAIRALSSLTRRDADAVRATVRVAARSHTVQEHDDYDGYLSLLITPADEAFPSFMVAGRSGSIDLAELHGDDMTTIGSFASIGAAMIVLRPALECPEPTGTGRQANALVHRHGADAALQAAMRADARPGRDSWPTVLRAIDDRNEAS